MDVSKSHASTNGKLQQVGFMKLFLLIFLSLLLFSCQQEQNIKSSAGTSADYDFNKKVNSVSAKDDFSDLKKEDDESCETEEEISKKLAAPKQEAFQLQGGDSGCEVDGHK